MTSRRDELRAHRFLARRVAAAVLTGRADPPTSVRAAVTTLLGAIVAVVALGSVAVYAVLRPSADAGWQRGGVVIVESETGARYVYLDGKLRPVLNYASARLILGSPDAPVVVASHTALASAVHGAPIGIAGAPDQIPAVGALDGGAWAVCSAGSAQLVVVDSAAGSVGSHGFSGAGPLSGGRTLGAEVIVVQAADGTDYLIRKQVSDRLTDPARVLATPGWAAVSPMPVGRAVLDAFPAGPPVDAVDVAEQAPTVDRVAPSATLCVQVTPNGAVAQTVVGASIGAADHVIVPAGRGALVRSLASPSGFASLCLLTDGGTCFPIADTATLASLGYASAPVVIMPDSVVALLPKGPVLSRTAADRSG